MKRNKIFRILAVTAVLSMMLVASQPRRPWRHRPSSRQLRVKSVMTLILPALVMTPGIKSISTSPVRTPIRTTTLRTTLMFGRRSKQPTLVTEMQRTRVRLMPISMCLQSSTMVLTRKRCAEVNILFIPPKQKRARY